MTSVSQLHQPIRARGLQRGRRPAGGAVRGARVRVSADAVVSAYVHEIATGSIANGTAHAGRRQPCGGAGPRVSAYLTAAPEAFSAYHDPPNDLAPTYAVSPGPASSA